MLPDSGAADDGRMRTFTDESNMAATTRGYAHRIDILAPASRVWAALLEPALLARWYGPHAHVRPGAGGSLDVTLAPDIERQAHIDVFEPAHRLRLIYLPTAGMPAGEGALVDDYLIHAEGDVTVVRLLGSGIPADKAWDAYYARLRGQTERALARLKVLMERKVAAPAHPGVPG